MEGGIGVTVVEDGYFQRINSMLSEQNMYTIAIHIE